MRLFVFGSTGSVANCYGILSQTIKEAMSIMKIEHKEDNIYWSVVNPEFEEYEKANCKRLSIPYDGPYRHKYRLLREFEVAGGHKSGMTFSVEE